MKSIHIFISLLVVFSFAHVCFAPYTINPDIPDSINPESPDSKTQKAEKASKVLMWTVLIIAVTLAVGAMVLIIYWGHVMYGGP